MKTKNYSKFISMLNPTKAGLVLLGLFLFTSLPMFGQSPTAVSSNQGVTPLTDYESSFNYVQIAFEDELVGLSEALEILNDAIQELQAALQGNPNSSASGIQRVSIITDYWRNLMILIEEAESNSRLNLHSTMLLSVPKLQGIFQQHGLEVYPSALNLFQETTEMLKK